jgi:hypothetical protein
MRCGDVSMYPWNTIVNDHDGYLAVAAGLMPAVFAINVGRWVARKYGRCPFWFHILFGLTPPFIFAPP